MRSHRFINSLLCLVIQLVAKESKVKENNAGIRWLLSLTQTGYVGSYAADSGLRHHSWCPQS